MPSCKSILTPNLLWTSFIKYERTMGFTLVKRWRDIVSPISINYFIFLNDIYLQYNFLESPQYLIYTYLNTLGLFHQIMNLIRIF